MNKKTKRFTIEVPDFVMDNVYHFKTQMEMVQGESMTIEKYLADLVHFATETIDENIGRMVYESNKQNIPR